MISNELECAESGEALVQEYRISRADGRFVWIRDEMTVVRGTADQEPPLFFGVFLDVSDRKRMEAELERLALYDSLTGLPNRALFSDRLTHAIERRGRGHATAVYFLDVDRFKRINDSLGHSAGDDVLREVAARIQRTLRPEDTVARFGGDEFTVLCETVGGVLEAVGVADRLQRELAEPVHAGGAELRLSASIGIAMAEPGDEMSASRLVEDADAAMYRAKERGGARTELFDMAMRERAVEELSIEQELQQGLERGELRLFYQPLVNLDNGEMVGAEALIRWEHPERGLLSPDKFLPVAEESGLIVQVGAWAVGEACRRLRDWDRRNGHGSPFTLAVNLSARELTHPDVVATVLNAVRRSALDPHRLTIEVTESTAMADRETGFRALRELSAAGVRIAIDDFGTGYSSLDHLREMPADILKIDRSFVAGMAANSPDSALVAAAVAMGRALEMEVVAEGIETSRPGGRPPRARLPLRSGLPLRKAAAARGARRAPRGRRSFLAAAEFLPELCADRPALVVAPLAAELQVLLGEALAHEAAAPNQRYRGHVAGLDVRLEPVEAHVRKDVVEDETHPLGHIALPLQARDPAVSDVRALEHAPHDLGDVEEAGDPAVAAQPDHERDERVVLRPPQQLVELGGGGRRRDPVAVELAAADHRVDEVVTITGHQRVELDPRACHGGNLDVEQGREGGHARRHRDGPRARDGGRGRRHRDHRAGGRPPRARLPLRSETRAANRLDTFLSEQAAEG